jgi:two-component system response regulator (stage 0 sporulation protein F)
MTRKLNRILAVDDEKFIRQLLADFLSLQGYDVQTAASGEQALEIIAAMKPQLVIMDIKMPGLNGLDVLRRIKATHKDVGVIMLSAFGDSSTIQAAYRQGADFYMQKPVNLDRLQDMLHTWQRGPQEDH